MAWVLLVLPLWLGYGVARRLLAESNGLVALALAPGLACLALVAGVSYLFYVFPLQAASVATCLLCGAVGAVLLKVEAPRLEWPAIAPRRWWPIGFLTAFALLWVHVHQMMVLDADTWIYSALTGLFLKGNYPPHHPFFPDLELHGHNGRNLLLAAVASLCGGEHFTVTWVSIDLLQAALVPLCFVLFHAATGDELQAVMATVFVCFGINMGSRAGLVDTLEGNNGLVNLLLFTLLYVGIRCLKAPRPAAAIVAGLSLGVYQMVYETHYGLVILTLAAMAAVLAKWEPARRGAILASLAAMILLSLPVAVTVGGQLTYQFEKITHRTPSAIATDQSQMLASQSIQLSFPKQPFLQVYMAPGYYRRVSVVWWVLAPYGFLAAGNDDYAYVPIWQPRYLKLFWLPLYLCPLTLWVLWKRRHATGVAWWIFGMISFLIPALVGFGPFFEEEYFRWCFAACLGFAAALGCASAIAMQAIAATDLSPGWRRLANVTIGLYIALNVLGMGSYTWQMADRLLRTHAADLAGSGFSATPIRHVIRGTHHFHADGTLQAVFSQSDVDACRWLQGRTATKAVTLRNFEMHPYWAILTDAYVSALAGTYMAGHVVPPTVAETLTPFRMSSEARRFWDTGDLAILRHMGVQWLYVDANQVRPEVLDRLRHDPGLRLGTDVRDDEGQERLVFEVVR